MRAQKTVSEQKADRGLSPNLTPPRGSGRLYAATWTLLGMLSLGYMGVLLLQPEWAAPITTQSLPTQEPSPDPSEQVARLSGEVDSLRQTVADLKQELTEVRSKSAAREVEIINQRAQAAIRPPSGAQQRDTETAVLQHDPEGVEPAVGHAIDSPDLRTTGVEPPPVPAGLPEPPPLVRQAITIQSLSVGGEPDVKATTPESGVEARQAKTIEGDREAAQGEPKHRKPALMPPPPAPVRKVVVLDVRPTHEPAPQPAATTAPPGERHALRMATGSLQSTQPPTITFGPPTVTPASDAFAVRLDAGPSLDALRLRWSVLNDRHRDALGGLEPRYLKSGSAVAPSYELLAGPIASVDEASRICSQLQARRVPCSVGGPFAGEAL